MSICRVSTRSWTTRVIQSSVSSIRMDILYCGRYQGMYIWARAHYKHIPIDYFFLTLPLLMDANICSSPNTYVTSGEVIFSNFTVEFGVWNFLTLAFTRPRRWANMEVSALFYFFLSQRIVCPSIKGSRLIHMHTFSLCFTGDSIC